MINIDRPKHHREFIFSGSADWNIWTECHQTIIRMLPTTCGVKYEVVKTLNLNHYRK